MSKRVTTEEFIEKARAVHGDRYDYSAVHYVAAIKDVKIICLEHGEFSQRPANHLSGRGCPKHGEFAQKPANHVRGVGCPKCGDESAAALRVLSTEDFISEAKAVHGEKYDYSKSVYKTMHDKVEILCRVHGSFWAQAANHVKGNQSGCPDCAESGFNPNMPGLLYYIAITTDDEQTLYKIGITNLSVEKRFPTADRARIRIVKLWHFDLGRKAADLEREILIEFEPYKYWGPKVLVGAGNDELFTYDVLNLDSGNDEDLTSDLPLFRRRQISLDL